MATQYTTWGPDTCTCRITYSWDDAVDPSVRVHTLHSVEVKCAAHASIVDLSLLQTVLDENRRKNITSSIAREQIGLAADSQLSWYNWAFTAGRVLQVTIAGIQVSQSVKNKIQAACDLQFGPLKVEIL